MHVFDTMNRPGNHRVYVTPARLEKGITAATNADWFDDNGPISMQIEFIGGRAKVEDNLGKLMVKHGLARKNRALLAA